MSKLLIIGISLCLLLSGCLGNTAETTAKPPGNSAEKSEQAPEPGKAPDSVTSPKPSTSAAPAVSTSAPPSANKPDGQSPGNGKQQSPAGSQVKDEPAPPQPAPEATGNLPSDQAQKIISARTSEVIAALKNKDMKKLSRYIHPEQGVRFSPYSYVETKTDLVFKADQLEKLFSDQTVRTWGHFDGSGEPIKMNFADYYAKFVYNHDFAKAEKTSYNETLGKGNTVNNIRDVYPKSIIVEYYFSGFDKSLEGHDWASLRLVYEHKDNQWYLTGIVHDQWTI